jgi:hypothetical protein
MTTPRIEETEDISDVCLRLGKAVDGKPFINIIEWGAVLREAKANWEAKAHQAFIVELTQHQANTIEAVCQIVEEMMEDGEHWQPIVKRIKELNK